MSHVVYLIGAGASAIKIPTVDGLHEKLKEFRTALFHFRGNKLEPAATTGAGQSVFEYCHEMIQCIDKVIENTKPGASASLDTYAKSLYLKNPSQHDYINLKWVLASFFLYLQFGFDPLDMRYDTFFASILDQEIKDFRTDISILSWNYDMQFELGYSRYLDTSVINENREALNLSDQGMSASSNKKFNVLKLNGTARSKFSHRNPFASFQQLQPDEIFVKLVNSIAIDTDIRFAWENDLRKNPPKENSVLHAAREALQNANALVLIGYSMPFFNVDVDRYILDPLVTRIRNATQAKRDLDFNVYIQDTYPKKVWEKLKFLLPMPESNVGFIDNTNQFHLPPELYRM